MYFSDEDEDFKKQVQQLRESMPFAVVGANAMVEIKGKKIRGRQYPWGIVEVENPSHCDFVKLRTMLITHMQDLQVNCVRSPKMYHKWGLKMMIEIESNVIRIFIHTGSNP